MVAGTGVLAGLHELGLLSDIKYITGVSGSSWAVGGMAFSKAATETLLPPRVPPQQLSLPALDQLPPEGSLARLVPTLRAAAAHIVWQVFESVL